MNDTNKSNQPNTETQAETQAVGTNTQTERAPLEARLRDFGVPGHEIPVDPDEAERLGAFQEDALSEEDARASSIDLSEEG